MEKQVAKHGAFKNRTFIGRAGQEDLVTHLVMEVQPDFLGPGDANCSITVNLLLIPQGGL